jgi:serine/threonine protein kinase
MKDLRIKAMEAKRKDPQFNNNVLELIDYCQMKNSVFLVTEFCNGGNLDDYRKTQKH